VKLKGATIKKVSAGAAKQAAAQTAALEALSTAVAVVEFTLLDDRGLPFVNEPFVVEFEDGSSRKGATDADGRAKVPAPKAGKVKLHLTRYETSGNR
jgi:hypothetical protein